MVRKRTFVEIGFMLLGGFGFISGIDIMKDYWTMCYSKPDLYYYFGLFLSVAGLALFLSGLVGMSIFYLFGGKHDGD